MRAAASTLSKEEMKLLTLEDIDGKKTVSTETWAVLGFIAYLIIGLLFYCYSSSHLTALDTIYLSVVTFSTVGYGDIHIRNRFFGAFYVLLGAGIIAALFSIFSNSVMEKQEEIMQKRFVDVANSMTKMASDTASRVRRYQRKKLQQYYEDLKQVDSTEMTAFTLAKQKMYQYMLNQILIDDSDKLHDMNMQVYEDELRQLRSRGLVHLLFVAFAVLSGATCMTQIEGWKFDEAFYWACVTVTTTGYGDVTPTTSAGKIFTIIYIVVACALAAKGFGDMVRYPLVIRAKKNELRIAQQFGSELSEETLRSVLQSDFFDRIPKLRVDDKQLVRSEFVLLVLEIMGKVQDKDILLACQIFDRLDVAADGVLDQADQEEQIRRARARDAEKVAEQLRKEAELEAERLKQQSLAEELFHKNLHNLTEIGSQIDTIFRSAIHATGEIAREATAGRFPLSSTGDAQQSSRRRKSQRLAEQEDTELAHGRASVRPEVFGSGDDEEKDSDDDLPRPSLVPKNPFQHFFVQSNNTSHHSNTRTSSHYIHNKPSSSTTNTKEARKSGSGSLPTSPISSPDKPAADRKKKKPQTLPTPLEVDFEDVEAATGDVAYAAASESPLRQPTTNPMILQHHNHQQQELLKRQMAANAPLATIPVSKRMLTLHHPSKTISPHLPREDFAEHKPLMTSPFVPVHREEHNVSTRASKHPTVVPREELKRGEDNYEDSDEDEV